VVIPADVVPLHDLSPADWLREELVDFGGRVREVVPTTGCEAVARVLHREHGPRPETGLWARIAEYCGTTLHPLAQYQMLAGLDRRSIAARRWPESTAPIPDVGSADRGSLTVLRDVLLGHTGTPDRCWFALWEGWGNLPRTWERASTFETPARRHLLFAGALADVVEISIEFACAGLEDPHPHRAVVTAHAGTPPPEPPTPREIADTFRQAGHLQSPSLWWPDDRSWRVASEIDFDSTLVAGSAALVAELVAHPGLEAFEVAPGDSLQYDGDPVNMR
jgi:hypothetical protein